MKISANIGFAGASLGKLTQKIILVSLERVGCTEYYIHLLGQE